MRSGRGVVSAVAAKRVSVARAVRAVLVLAAVLALTFQAVSAQEGEARKPTIRSVVERALSDRFRPSSPPRPAYSIPAGPLGFAEPSSAYLGMRISQVSLDFIGENRLLFTFRVPGLLRRDADSNEERKIRAVVLDLPSGTVEAATEWTVHDYERYLWMLRDGHFLLRDRNNLIEGDTTLRMKLLLQFPGLLLWLELDPTQQLMVTSSREPLAAPHQLGGTTGSSSASASGKPAEKDSTTPPEYVLRVLRRDSSRVILVSRLRTPIRLPINPTGYIENLRGRDSEWTLSFNHFTGGSRVIANVESACMPEENFVSTDEMLVTACSDTGGNRLMAMTTKGRILWAYLTPATDIWPKIVIAPDGSRIARETLVTSYTIGPFSPLGGASSLRGQLVRVFDAASGELVLQLPVKPVLDGGGNVAISPHGRRVALLNADAIQIFDLPPASPLPSATKSLPRHE